MGKSLLLLGILLSLSLRAYFIFHGSQIADVHALNEMGQMVLRGINPYLALNYYTYPPLALYLEAFIANLSQTIHIPFYILTKILPNLADVLTTLLIYWFLIKKSIRPFSAACWSLAFFLNPLSIIISSAHGQLDSIPIFLTVCAIFIVTFKTKLNFVLLAGGVLGLAIAIKPGPLMLLPFFITFRKTGLKMMTIFSIAAIVPISILILPFLQGSPNLVLQKVINYSGSYDFGLSAILRGLYYGQSRDYLINFGDDILLLDKLFFIAGLFFLVFIYRNRQELLKACLTVYLLFLGCYLGISAQYLAWVLPFAVLEREKMIIPFSLAGTVALIGFYLFINPAILSTQLGAISLYQPQFMLVYFVGNLIYWLITLYWLFKLVSKTRYP